MRDRTTFRQPATLLTRSTAVLAVMLLTAISVISLVSRAQAQDPATGSGEVTITYFGALALGSDRWFVDGLVQADDISNVSITLAGAAHQVGTIRPDAVGFFAFELTARPFDKVTATATNGTSTSRAEVTLDGFF